MAMMMGKKYDEDTRKFSLYSKYKKECKCGHIVVIKPSRDKILCSHCGHYVYRTKADEFKAEMGKRLK